MTALIKLFATCPKGTADLLAAELTEFGATQLGERAGGVAFEGSLETAYRTCLWSRIANRVLLIIARYPAPDSEQLYAGAVALDWSVHLAPNGTLAVDAVTHHPSLTHSLFVAQRIKDAIVDRLRLPDGVRPNVDTFAPDLRVNVYLDRSHAQVAIDLVGASLHERGYRTHQGAAPLKENLAAAVLLRAGWRDLARAGAPLVDLMCGSGTLAIEAGLIAADIAPGLLHSTMTAWRGHEPALWASLLSEAEARRAIGLTQLPAIVGFDADPTAIQIAWDNLTRAGLHGYVHVEKCAVDEVRAANTTSGLVVCNPPYGERLGDDATLRELYQALGRRLRESFSGWEAAILTGTPGLGMALGIKARRTHTLYNGAIECRLLRLRLTPEFFAPDLPPGSAQIVRAQQRLAKRGPLSDGAQMFANRLRKNLRLRTKWARRENVRCYRLYDADMPEYALALDIYEGELRWVHAQEYAPPATITEDAARERLDEALAQLPELIEIPVAQVIFKRRTRQRGSAQYERVADAGNFIEVTEGDLKFLVNLRDYLDTGLFLDHRLTRALLRARAPGQDMLNLFGYTGSASVYAAAGGARSTTAVDLSTNYTHWARRNLALNGFTEPRHRVLQADCLTWLARRPDQRYGLVFLDPPTFSNSKRMDGTLDVQRDHVELIRQTLRWLTPDGTLIFSTNHQRFKFDYDALSELAVKDLSRQTLPEDFQRHARIHQCFEISPSAS
ncbi:MAG: bifunctional 23S rRNA (guanine(2069)-N(7))-methyltransferase RlmK/23S rRNA (guanine(2445)-N(2))-methyltransferase RlmL [Gammaproteobacteria bacterium]|nr:bifunctional 23S rRNA (guanine(2069)-N(7))-methyltransferase RlmK/23S rRNA (guanine(2445)-N(2))-methyltransferase RlmL [Gammaproteobacteria bacterium]